MEEGSFCPVCGAPVRLKENTTVWVGLSRFTTTKIEWSCTNIECRHRGEVCHPNRDRDITILYLQHERESVRLKENHTIIETHDKTVQATLEFKRKMKAIYALKKKRQEEKRLKIYKSIFVLIIFTSLLLFLLTKYG